jgi:hypothetical protein
LSHPGPILKINRTTFVMYGDRTYAKVRWHKSATMLKQKRMLCMVTTYVKVKWHEKATILKQNNACFKIQIGNDRK